MAEMDAAQRNACHREFEEEFFNRVRAATGLSRADIRAFIDALDTYFSDNEIAINQAIPQPARSTLTTSQKAGGMRLVLKHRYQAGV